MALIDYFLFQMWPPGGGILCKANHVLSSTWSVISSDSRQQRNKCPKSTPKTANSQELNSNDQRTRSLIGAGSSRELLPLSGEHYSIAKRVRFPPTADGAS